MPSGQLPLWCWGARVHCLLVARAHELKKSWMVDKTQEEAVVEEEGLWQYHKARIFPSLRLPYTLSTTGAIRRDSLGFL